VSSTRRAILAAGALAVAPAAAARAQPASDADLLEDLLALERRLAGAYDAALERGVLGAELARRLRDQERVHARGLERALDERGRRPADHAPARDAGLRRALRSGTAFGRYALALERRAVRAYVRGAVEGRDDLLRPSLGAILACEAEHEVALREALGLPLLGV
jgi:hypothetical protein